jgi:hypothetical protein
MQGGFPFTPRQINEMKNEEGEKRLFSSRFHTRKHQRKRKSKKTTIRPTPFFKLENEHFASSSRINLFILPFLVPL